MAKLIDETTSDMVKSYKSEHRGIDMKKRAILIVLDSAGIGALPDAADFGDVGANTI